MAERCLEQHLVPLEEGLKQVPLQRVIAALALPLKQAWQTSAAPAEEHTCVSALDSSHGSVQTDLLQGASRFTCFRKSSKEYSLVRACH